MKKLSIYFAAALCLASALSCNKEEKTTNTYSLSGLEMNGVAAFIAKDDYQHITLNVSKLKSSSGTMPDKIGLYYQVNSAKRDTLTKDIKANPVTSFDYRADSVATFTITCYAYDVTGKLYSSAVSSTFMAIDPDNSLTGLLGTVPDGGKYIEKNIGGLTWMAQNLYETPSGLPYESCEVMNTIFGRYYTYEEALTACPAGWRLPTAAEWDALGTDAGALMANAVFLDNELWTYSKEVKITNALGFNAIPAGYIDRTGLVNINSGTKEFALFWTADAKDATMAHYRYILGTNPTVQEGEGSRTSLALSVRCVK